MPTTTSLDLGPGPEKQWFEKLAAGSFVIQRCGACSAHVFYPRVLCTHCGSRSVRWVVPSGRGTVYSTTIVRRSTEEGGDFNIALIDLDEGPRMMGRVVGMAPEAVQIGMNVSARVEREGEQNIVVWESSGGSAP